MPPKNRRTPSFRKASPSPRASHSNNTMEEEASALPRPPSGAREESDPRPPEAGEAVAPPRSSADIAEAFAALLPLLLQSEAPNLGSDETSTPSETVTSVTTQAALVALSRLYDEDMTAAPRVDGGASPPRQGIPSNHLHPPDINLIRPALARGSRAPGAGDDSDGRRAARREGGGERRGSAGGGQTAGRIGDAAGGERAGEDPAPGSVNGGPGDGVGRGTGRAYTGGMGRGTPGGGGEVHRGGWYPGSWVLLGILVGFLLSGVVQNVYLSSPSSSGVHGAGRSKGMLVAEMAGAGAGAQMEAGAGEGSGAGAETGAKAASGWSAGQEALHGHAAAAVAAVTIAEAAAAYFPLGFRALAAQTAAAISIVGGGEGGSSGDGSDEIIPLGSVPGTSGAAAAVLAARKARTTINTVEDTIPSTLVEWAPYAGGTIALSAMAWSMRRWSTPVFALAGSLAVVAVAAYVSFDLAAGAPVPSGSLERRDVGGGEGSSVHTIADTRSLRSWGCEEVTLWLKSEAGEWAGQYREKLCVLSVGAYMLLQMDDGDLRADLGVTSRLHRRQLLAAADKLRHTVAAGATRYRAVTAASSTMHQAVKVLVGRLGLGSTTPHPNIGKRSPARTSHRAGAGLGRGVGRGAGAATLKYKANVNADAEETPGADDDDDDVDADDSAGGLDDGSRVGGVGGGYLTKDNAGVNCNAAALPPHIASLSTWLHVSPAYHTLQVLGVTNCPRLRMLRDVLVGDGSLASLVGIHRPPPPPAARSPSWIKGGGDGDGTGTGGGGASISASTLTVEARARENARAGARPVAAATAKAFLPLVGDFSSSSPRLNQALLALWFVCPGVIVSLRAHELWGLGTPAGVWGVVLGFALTTMWAQGLLEVAVRWQTAVQGNGIGSAGTRHGRAARATGLLVLTRCVYPGLARAIMLEIFGLVLYICPGGAFVAAVVGVLGGVAMPVSRVVYRTWYVSSRQRGSQWASDREFSRVRVLVREQEDRMAVGRTEVDGSEAPSRLHFHPWGDGRGLGGTLDEVDEFLENTRTMLAAEAAVEAAMVPGPGGHRGGGGFPPGTMAAAAGAASEAAAAINAIANNAPSIRLRSSARSHWPGPISFPDWLNEENAPAHFRCPITLCVIREPAVTPAGISYERAALMQWLDHQHTEPSTKQRLKRSHVVPNLTFRAMIEDWLEEQCAARRRIFDPGASGPASAAQNALTSAAEIAGSRSGRSAGGRFGGGLPLGAVGVLQSDRDQLRLARQHMYASLKDRAALNVCVEEQRWAAYQAAREGVHTGVHISTDARGVSDSLIVVSENHGIRSLDRSRQLSVTQPISGAGESSGGAGRLLDTGGGFGFGGSDGVAGSEDAGASGSGGDGSAGDSLRGDDNAGPMLVNSFGGGVS